MLDRLKNDQRINIELFEGKWLDIGRPDDYDYANDNFEELAKLLGLP